MSTRPLAAAVAVALLATAGGVYLARQGGGYAPTATASGTVTVEPAHGTPAALGGHWPARYCASYANVARQSGYVYEADLGGRGVLSLADSVERTPGPQDVRRVTLALVGQGRRWTWTPDARGTVTLSDDQLTAHIDALLVGASASDTLPLRAVFECKPRVDPRKRRR